MLPPAPLLKSPNHHMGWGSQAGRGRVGAATRRPLTLGALEGVTVVFVFAQPCRPRAAAPHVTKPCLGRCHVSQSPLGRHRVAGGFWEQAGPWCRLYLVTGQLLWSVRGHVNRYFVLFKWSHRGPWCCCVGARSLGRHWWWGRGCEPRGVRVLPACPVTGLQAEARTIPRAAAFRVLQQHHHPQIHLLPCSVAPHMSFLPGVDLTLPPGRFGSWS